MDEQIAAFNAVTGNENGETAKFFLESSQNSLEAAINMYLESGGAAPGTEAAAGGDDDAMAGLDEDSPVEEEAAPEMAVSNGQDPNSEEQRWYTGGPQGGSGQEVIAPGQGKDMMNNLMTELAPHGRTGNSEDLKAPSGAFTGSARTLDGQVKPAKKEAKKVVVKLFANEVFTVDDGPPRDIYDPANTAFLNSIKRQEVPAELRTQNAEIQLSLMQIPKDYDPADFPKPAFSGAGNRLDGGQASSSGAASSSAAQPAEPWRGPDDSKPTTSIQIRMPDGSRLVGKFNLDQKIREIRAFVASARPADKRTYQMLTGFPQAPIPDESITIEAGGLKGSVVIFK